MRILVIDDSKTARAVVKKILREIGHHDVAEATNGQEGLDRVGDEPFDLIICDWKMPVLDGLEFVKQVQGTPSSHVPVIMVSSESYVSRIVEVMRAGAQGYIRKPFMSSALQAKIIEVQKKVELAAQHKAEASALSGSLSEIGFPELVQFIATSRLSGRLELESPTHSGVLGFGDGEVRAAEFQGLDGEDAFFALAEVDDGRFRFQPSSGPVQGSMRMATTPLLMEAMRRRDERAEAAAH